MRRLATVVVAAIAALGCQSNDPYHGNDTMRELCENDSTGEHRYYCAGYRGDLSVFDDFNVINED